MDTFCTIGRSTDFGDLWDVYMNLSNAHLPYKGVQGFKIKQRAPQEYRGVFPRKKSNVTIP